MADGGWSGPDDPGTGTPSESSSAGRRQTAPSGDSGGGFASQGGPSGEVPGPAADRTDPLRPRLTADGGRAPIEAPVCQFLRSINPDGTLDDPGSVAVSNHRCAAFGDPLPLSLRQQELVCLQRVHLSCPRYLRGTVLGGEAARAAPQEDDRNRPGLVGLAALALVIVAIAILVTGPVLGILPFGGAGSTPSPIIVVVSPSASRATPTLIAATSPGITPGPTRTPALTATGTANQTAVASATWPPGATASRMNLLTRCPNGQNCYIYSVRGPGQNGSQVTDTLQGIAGFFGVKVDAIVALNQGLTSSSVLTAGQQLRIPPPTR